MCSNALKRCGKGVDDEEEECDFCFQRSFASYDGLTPKGKRKVDCLVNAADAQRTICCATKVAFHCDVCHHIFESNPKNVTNNGQWCRMCSNV